MNAIAPETIRRARKILALTEPESGASDAERLTAARKLAQLYHQHPGLEDAMEEAEARENAQKVKIVPAKTGTILDPFIEKVQHWAEATHNEFFEDQEIERARRRNRKTQKAPQPRKPNMVKTVKPSFAEQLADSILIEEDGIADVDLEDADGHKVDGIQITFAVPAKLWDQVLNRKDGAKSFLEALDAAIADALDGDPEEDPEED